MNDVSKKRHLAKTITWRLVATIDTIILSWIITGNPLTGLKIGAAEIVTKMFLYYAHERLWFKLNLNKKGELRESTKRHVAKTITWRTVGTLDTMLLSWIISGNPLIGLKIGLGELVTKMVLYYFHERAWYKINFGLASRKNTIIDE